MRYFLAAASSRFISPSRTAFCMTSQLAACIRRVVSSMLQAA
jgi:hypothetical protein